ncbi:MAG: M43 family zinc metalloprotease, partial [Bacteroidota bacterium]
MSFCPCRIHAQINQLNLDFARLNTDAVNTPSAFAGVAANTNIQFCLAVRDPNGVATTGIVRKSTTATSFTYNDAVKSASTGGANPWPSSRYLNFWSCNTGGSLLGYAQFPGGSSTTDGVVVLYSTIGSMVTRGTKATYDFGRVATHEVGHWVNLRHIWGDETACIGSDNVGDTPNQSDKNFFCPSFPRTDACSPSPGVMFMNYMDY